MNYYLLYSPLWILLVLASFMLDPGRVDLGASGILLALLAVATLTLILAFPGKTLVGGNQLTFLLFITAKRLAVASCADWRVAVLLQSLGALLLGHPDVLPESRQGWAYRNCRSYLRLSALLGIAGVMVAGGEPSHIRAPGVILLSLSIFCQLGIFPFHSWRPRYAELASPLAAMAMITDPTPVLVLSRLVRNQVSMPFAWTVTILTLLVLTALYSASLSCVQTRCWRWLGWLGTMQWSLAAMGVLAGDITTRLGGDLIIADTVLVMSGLCLCMYAIEIRLGPLDIGRYNGLARSMPGMASIFLLLCLGSFGFPGTLAFAGLELLLEGIMEVGGLAPSIFVAISLAIGGISLLRAFFAVFCGPRGHSGRLTDITAGERRVLLLIVLSIALLGTTPQLLLSPLSWLERAPAVHSSQEPGGFR